MKIENLRSPHDTVGGMVYFGRMLDKIRLHAAAQLPSDYVENLGGGFDERCCKYLHVPYEALKKKVLSEPSWTDEQFLAWCGLQGRTLDENEIDVWNGFMTRRGWKDEAHERLVFRLKEAGLPEDGKILTMFDFIDVDEGRAPKG